MTLVRLLKCLGCLSIAALILVFIPTPTVHGAPPTNPLTWNTFLGGNSTDWADGIVTDQNSTYVFGTSYTSWGNPIDPFEPSPTDAYIARINSATGQLIWNTFLGGPAADSAGRAVLYNGKLIVVGSSSAAWGNPLNPFGGNSDGLIAALDPATGTLLWHTFLGTTHNTLSALTVHGDTLYMVGTSQLSWGMPINPFRGHVDILVTAFDANTGVLRWHTFLGGGGLDQGFGITASGNTIFITGESNATWGTPVRPYVNQTDAFVAAVDASLGTLRWNTFLGGFGNGTIGTAITADRDYVYVSGLSYLNWETPVNAYAGGPGPDTFVARLEAVNGVLLWNTFMGTTGNYDSGTTLALSGNRLYVGGSSDGTWGTPIQPFNGISNGFLASLDASTGQRLWNTFLGADHTAINDLSISNGSFYVVGSSTSTWGHPVRRFTRARRSTDVDFDAFAARLDISIPEPTFTPGPSLTPSNTRTLTPTITPTFTPTTDPCDMGTMLKRVSTSSEGIQGNAGSGQPKISADGRYVLFYSGASNLVSGDTNNTVDIFMYDRLTCEQTLLSTGPSGIGNEQSTRPTISSSNRYIAFESYASNFVTGDTNNQRDIFVLDRSTGEIERISVSSDNEEANNISENPSISGDGRYVVFESSATNLVPNDTNARTDIFLRDRVTQQTNLISRPSTGQANSSSEDPVISDDGNFVAFASDASNLVSGDSNGNLSDIFHYNRNTGTITLVSISRIVGSGSHISVGPTISADGRYVAFSSYATNLVANDFNNFADAFVRDTQLNQTILVSAADGTTNIFGNYHSGSIGITGDGKYVTFSSRANNLIPGDTTDLDLEILIRRLDTNQTIRVTPFQGIYEIFSPSSALNAPYFVFYSYNATLVSGDTNGESDVFVAGFTIADPPTPTPTITPSPSDTPVIEVPSNTPTPEILIPTNTPDQ